MRTLIKKFLLNIIVLYLIQNLISAFKVSDKIDDFLWAGLFLFLLRQLIAPLLNLLLLPLNIITLNMTNWILQIFIIFIWVIITPSVQISSWDFPGLGLGWMTLTSSRLHWFPVFLLSALLIVILNKFVGWIFK